ncbi:hypothetical protein QRD43_02225 [Pelomonas sp. APW6]|uniref:Uncharacterized protein n=1 Tax=Roseateles subflavus TaxID=3053353 RepID=A0ABT7LCX2_9BURK|nr:hypothetical protein [Pelomonas sp. APW6]MDL5030709.1 hypothetical protein [Pelomonas sp. APW6]
MPLGTPHWRRLREIWRSAGWPCQDLIEVELLAAGLLERLQEDGRERLRVTDAGVQALAATLDRNRRARDAHEQLVGRVALELQRAGRVVWRGLTLRAGLPGEAEAPGAPAPLIETPAPPAQGRPRWVQAMPDVFSIRHTTVPDYLDVAVHEIKVRRADLLGELRRPAKSQAYLALSSQCWFVLQAGIAEPEEIPADFGVLIAHAQHLALARPAPRRAHQPDFGTWMALARHACEPAPADDAQAWLGEAQSPPGPDPG